MKNSTKSILLFILAFFLILLQLAVWTACSLPKDGEVLDYFFYFLNFSAYLVCAIVCFTTGISFEEKAELEDIKNKK